VTAASTRNTGWIVLLAGLLLTFAIYMQGIGGGYLFDDYPNIVDNKDVQPAELGWVPLVRAALASPASEFKRPLASLSFAVNYLLTGANPEPMKVTNIAIHLLNGIACFFLTRLLAAAVAPLSGAPRWRPDLVAALVATGWMLLPINLTSVLYVVQRMESLANLAVFLGLIGYVKGRQLMRPGRWGGLLLAITSITFMPLLGVLAKETAAMVPLYALCIELAVFRGLTTDMEENSRPDRRIRYLFIALLAIPFVLGSAWLSVKLSNPRSWASRDFTLYTRLLSECRIVIDYIAWTIFPRADDLSFYHDDFAISSGWIHPATTLTSALSLVALIAACVAWRRRLPLVSLGIALFLACQSLTSTVIPLELIYEHRNYFASYGLMLALVPLLAAPELEGGTTQRAGWAGALLLPRRVLLAAMMAYWGAQTWMTSTAWNTPVSLARELAERGPDSPRAQYELGRMYIVMSRYEPNSPFVALAYPPLERAMALPKSSILPEQALIFLNSRLHLPLKESWWNSMVEKLGVRRPSVQDESSLGALGTCAIGNFCDLPKDRMIEAFGVALSHPNPTARLQAMYADYAWSALGDRELATRMIEGASRTAPGEPTYSISLIQFLIAQARFDEASSEIRHLSAINFGSSQDAEIERLRARLERTRKQVEAADSSRRSGSGS
jgi:hypothetical protein